MVATSPAASRPRCGGRCASVSPSVARKTRPRADRSGIATRDEAEAYLRSPFDVADLTEEGLALTIVTGSFSDCWIKSQAAPRVGEAWIAPFSRSQLYVQRPGQHPGGRAYWTTPRADVLVALVERA